MLYKHFVTKTKYYFVFYDGKVLDCKTNRFITPRVDSNGYVWVGGFKLHEMIADLFLIRKPILTKERLVINHKDGNKSNNSVDNLEWCTYWYNNYHARQLKLNDVIKSNKERWENPEFRKRVSKNISLGLKKSQANKRERNPRFKYIITKQDKRLTRQELSRLLGLSQSYTDNLIYKCANFGIENSYFLEHKIKISIKQS